MTMEKARAIRVTPQSAKGEDAKTPIAPGDTLLCAEHVARLRRDWAKSETQLCAALRRKG
jgi:hypothetical protein